MELINDEKSHFDISKIIILMVVLFAIAFLSMPAKATETFNETFSFAGAGQNTESVGTGDLSLTSFGTGQGELFSFRNNFDAGKIITSVRFNNQFHAFPGAETILLSGSMAGINSNYTTFTSTASCGVTNYFYGNGTIGWERTTGNNFRYVVYFNNVNSSCALSMIGKHSVQLSYDTTVYTGSLDPATTSYGNIAAEMATDAQFTNIVGFYSVAQSVGVSPVIVSTYGTSSVSFTFADTATETFNQTDSVGKFGYLNLTKNGFNMRLNATNSTSYSFYDVTSTSNVSQYLYYGGGLNTAVYDVVAGLWVNRTIYTSGGVTPTPTPTPTPAPTAPPASSTTGAAISWNKASYNINDIGILTGNVTVAPPLFGDIRVTIVNSSGQQAFYIWDSSGTFPQTESFLFSFPSADLYTANLISHSPLFGDTNIANATAQAVAPISYIFAPSTVVTGSNISISYKFNPTPTAGAIEDTITDEFGFGGVSTYINTTLCPCDNSTHSISYIINGVGKHTLRLWDTTNIKVVANTIVDVTSSGAIVPGNITSNQLFLDATTYSVNDVINGQYQISSVNWSSYGYFKASLVSSGNISMGSVTLDSQVGTFQMPVTGGAFNIFQSGAANVTIFAGNSVLSATNAMVSVPVTILADKNGYSISVNPVNICRTQTEYVKYTSPSGAGILQVMSMTPVGTTKFTNVSFTQNGTQKFVFNDGTIRDKSGIIFNVLDTNGAFQVNSIVKYQSTGCTAPGVTATATATPGAGVSGGGGDVINLLSSNIFWALIMISGLMMYIAKETMGQKK